jgi:hypothetical protein
LWITCRPPRLPGVTLAREAQVVFETQTIASLSGATARRLS